MTIIDKRYVLVVRLPVGVCPPDSKRLELATDRLIGQGGIGVNVRLQPRSNIVKKDSARNLCTGLHLCSLGEIPAHNSGDFTLSGRGYRVVMRLAILLGTDRYGDGNSVPARGAINGLHRDDFTAIKHLYELRLYTGASTLGRSLRSVPPAEPCRDRRDRSGTENVFYGPYYSCWSKQKRDRRDRKEKDLGLTREAVERNTSHTSSHTSQNRLYGRNTCQKTVPTVPTARVIHNLGGEQ